MPHHSNANANSNAKLLAAGEMPGHSPTSWPKISRGEADKIAAILLTCFSSDFAAKRSAKNAGAAAAHPQQAGFLDGGGG
jgi:hypothetical protein